MSQQTINIGSAPGSGDGESLRSGGIKINANFTELYDAISSLGGREITDGTKITALRTNSNWIDPGDFTNLLWWKYTGTAIAGLIEHNYYIGSDLTTGVVYEYMYKKIDTTLTLTRRPLYQY